MASSTIKYNELNIINSFLYPTVTNDVLADATSCDTVATFRGSGGSYTGNLPHADFAFGVFLVIPRTTQRTVIAFYIDRGIAMNLYHNGAWQGWHTINLDS